MSELNGPLIHTSMLLYVWNDLEIDKRLSLYKFVPLENDESLEHCAW